ncbi:Subtilisin-like protease [Platanthera guangdongensis]|uniref:Subtilisin-like protease n=1 Tax=Platanthera guangdongensis TaxID=2320717 RepID=A0ABR2MEG6_9ASPA
MSPVPSRWRGECQTGELFSNSSCNKKIIGARYYLGGYESEKENSQESQQNSINTVELKSPRDTSGHGSHTASTAAGRFVDNMNYDGLASGGARGGAPLARIAIYKACWDSGCYDADLLAAFNDAIEDGVDIISISLGPESPQGDYFNDAISIGSFHAAGSGILVVASAGNAGARGSVTNLAPWMFTVAASSTDREFVSKIRLGSGINLMGVSLNTHQMNSTVLTMAASEANDGYFTPYQSSYCLESSLNRTKARGKVLVCHHSGSSSESRMEKSMAVKKAGGVGMILIDEREDTVALPFIIPASSIDREVGDRVLSYLNTTRRPTSLISRTKTVLGLDSAPRVAAFSSRGPNSLTPEILKPDIMAPGLNILAAWSPVAKKINFNIISGTSMSCPHVTGLVALIKSAYPNWSPAAIKSAVMTTATALNKKHGAIISDPEKEKANPFDYGAGFPVPFNMLNPGLIYDVHPSDYKDFICSIGYNDKSLQQITGDNSVCSKSSPAASNLNYPSIAVPNIKHNISVTRTLTNVGKPRSIYRAAVYSPGGLNVTVVPKFLLFTSFGQKKSFALNIRVNAPLKDYVFGSLSWISADARVTSPFIVGTSSSRIGRI